MSTNLAVDGVRIIRHPGHQAHTDATLTFGVGARDETLRTVGVCHLIEHLAMSRARHTPIEIQAEVDLETTDFYASGSPARVAEFLRTVCETLAGPPVDRLAVEAGVLAAEAGSVTHPIASFLLSCRYGAEGPGLAWFLGAGYDGLTADHVRSFVRRWFIASNALLQITGPVPESLRLPLPSGSRPERNRPAGRTTLEPYGVTWDIPGAGIMLRSPAPDAARLAVPPGLLVDVLSRRIEEECRHIGGHSYLVDHIGVGVGDGRRDTVIFADARDGTERMVGRIVIAALRDLANHGPTAREVEMAVARAEEQQTGKSGEVWPVWAAAMHDIMGEPIAHPPDLNRIRTATPADVAAALTAVMPTVVLYVHEDAADELTDARIELRSACPVHQHLPPGRIFKPPLASRVFTKDARDAVLVLATSGIGVRDVEGQHFIGWEEIAGVMRCDRAHLVFGRNGCLVPVDPDMFRGAQTVTAELLRRVDPDLIFDQSKYLTDD